MIRLSTLILTPLLLTMLFNSSSMAQDTIMKSHERYKWTELDTEEYAKRNLDSNKWSLKKLKNDLNNRHKDSSGVKLPLSDYPSPVVEYSGNGSALIPLSIELEEKTIHGYTLAHFRDKYNDHLFRDSIGQYYTFFTILYLTDKPNSNKGNNPNVVSRNYPHYLFTGTQNTSLGDIDWIQMTLGSSENFAIVTQRYFDLKLGRTILIAPLTDGSIRLLQIKDSPETYTWDELANQSISSVQKFVQNFKSNKKVLAFFNQNNVIEQH